MNYPTHPSYDQLHEGCLAFAQTYDAPDVILGLLRGGMFNAIVLSHIYGDIPVIPVDYASRKGKGDNRNHHGNDLPGLLAGYRRILLVDDICDSGFTIAEIVKAYEERISDPQWKYEITTYCSYWKEGAVADRVDYTWRIPEDSPWIIFPWEDL